MPLCHACAAPHGLGDSCNACSTGWCEHALLHGVEQIAWVEPGSAPSRQLAASVRTHLRNQSSVLGDMLTWPQAGPASWLSMQLADMLRQDSALAKWFQVLT